LTFIIENKNTFFVVIMYFMWLLKIYWNCDICNTCTSRRILNNVGYYMKLKYEEKISWIIYWTHKTFCGKHCLWKESLYSVALMVNNFTDINKMNDHLSVFKSLRPESLTLEGVLLYKGRRRTWLVMLQILCNFH
jgi:hypothetical protein